MGWTDYISPALGVVGGVVGGIYGGPGGAIAGYSAGSALGGVAAGALGSGDNSGLPGGGVQLPYFEQDRQNVSNQLQGRSPYASKDWDGLISGLQQTANGTQQGLSLAQQQYNQANQSTVANLSALSSGTNNPEMARQALIQQARVGQGQAAGLALAGTQERQAAMQGLTGALGARDQLNQSAYQNLLGNQTQLSTAQLGALTSDQQAALQQQQINAQKQAAQYNSLSGLLSAGVSIYGKSGGSGTTTGGVQVTNTPSSPSNQWG